MGLLELCSKYFGTTNLYEVLKLSEDATDKEVKRAYHKLSLQVHPDRVEENEKLEATEKFKVLGSIHAILSDTDKRAIYNKTRSVDEDDYTEIINQDWNVYWRILFKKITLDDIKNYEKEYIGSIIEKEDIKKAYIAGKGDMDYIVDHVQFARSEHEPRIREILNKMIKDGKVPAYKIFTHEPAKKKQKRLAKENREAKQVAKEQKKNGASYAGANSLELMIKKKQESRAEQLDSFVDSLADKYGAGRKKTTSRATKRKAPQISEKGTKRRK